MKKYEVTYTQRVDWRVWVEAENEDEAREKADAILSNPDKQLQSQLNGSGRDDCAVETDMPELSSIEEEE